ncbi:MAG: lipoate protein ligase C-terminal domain-containing protein [Candidatus Altiarchaeota archaeon]
MMGKFVMKVPGGKLLKVAVQHDSEKIVKIKLCGDFFMHPEDALESLEGKLIGARLSQVRGIVADELADVRLYGVDVNSIVKAIWGAVG